MDNTDISTSKSNTGQVLLEALEKSWRKYLMELKRCREDFSNEAVHDLRVATRRLMAVIQLLNSAEPRPRLKKIIRQLMEQLDEFDDLRDAQVILAEISETIQELPELQPLQKQQRRRENLLLRSVRKKLQRFNYKELSRRVHKTRDSISAEVDGNLASEILQAVDDAYMIAEQRLASMDLARPATIHRVRIAFKKFRYGVEVIHPFLQGFPENNLEAMHKYQALMGEVQDAEVFLQTLHNFFESGSFADSESVRYYYERRHAEAISAYADHMNQIHGFWRSEPDKPFPWEKPE